MAKSFLFYVVIFLQNVLVWGSNFLLEYLTIINTNILTKLIAKFVIKVNVVVIYLNNVVWANRVSMETLYGRVIIGAFSTEQTGKN